ncbi:SDR family NAD(P)-dependent oxidoreductase [candidate division KSB1 bacterium]|nr:SDR family NAD(P)-dependent oxidoreductase [candidate division KSB1 bacterium]NIR70280.1 SDR family NAD(P)-dependent oxidoreductase [candidate division KSB1 bacterium]NIS26550.1 SDR family NAD(P)-dependent oxidoreductase [candidate division KSB1 bacterium]NIT73313.1 SDR family NAD(P)-dependent oxidoreductase [candidate division KSB1 bacterium]NIU23936.1 SDR family NAD(P)-dependent oxidoreductase [candidate division KSB1 bacterium]
MNLQDKTALITGAARGIGQATSVELAHAGANIIGVDLKVEDLSETSKAVEQLGTKFYGFACDVSDESSVRMLVKQAETTDGGFDILVNNAGVLPSGPFLERDFEVWRRTIDINLTGLMMLTYVALPHLFARKVGHIVNIASIAGKFGTEGVAVYAASKHGVVGFSSALRFELQQKNIGVSWICPSLVNTRMSSDVQYTFLTPKVEPETIARAVRQAIETNATELFVPRRVRLAVSILPSLAPRFSRWLTRVTKASKGWLIAKKELAA